MQAKKIKSALISVFNKDGLGPIIESLHQNKVTIYSTGGTADFITRMGVPVSKVESLTTYPSILDGRVKTLHPKIFGGILARREKSHLAQLDQFDIPELDLVIVDLYPFEETVQTTDDHEQIIEKIDIGGIALIRAAAKNFKDVVIVPSKNQYAYFLESYQANEGGTEYTDRQYLAGQAFAVSNHYDGAIADYFATLNQQAAFRKSLQQSTPLRYGENPHQYATYYGDLIQQVEQFNGKELSYNNLVDVDAAIALIREFKDAPPTFVVIKHTNACGVATANTVEEAWKKALEGDPISAFGGILITNAKMTLACAREIDQIFYEVLIAPEYDQEAYELLAAKKNRILLKDQLKELNPKQYKSLLNGVIEQESDLKGETIEEFRTVTQSAPSVDEWADMVFANKCVKHLKSNAIALVKDQQLLGMGCGNTSRIDALKAAITKARQNGFDLKGAVLASDAFFPFADSVEIAFEAGIKTVVQPGGSVKDKDSVKFCNQHDMTMVFTGTRHFRH
jgi:phosphoribosylaminoimidazolecarboxamide formyltransferase/IMP cyclohydrolase